ncbi:MAG: MBL fold metallo-hydrolase [Pseudomonadota bacterium]
MFILDRRTFLAAAGAAAVTSTAAQAGLAKVQTYTAGLDGVLVESVVVMGEDSAVLIDAQLIAPEAAALADMIAATGRKLETIFISHYHPDHVLGLDVLLKRFPEAKTYTHAKVRPLIEKAAPGMLASFSKSAPAGVFAEKAVIPDVLDADHILLEGERIEILDPMHGDTDLITPIHIPSLDTLIATDLAYANVHLWVAENLTPERIETWRGSLDALEAIGAGTVIPGHRQPGDPADASVYAMTRDYLDHWETALAETKTAEDLRATLLAGKEDLAFPFAVDRAVLAAYPES